MAYHEEQSCQQVGCKAIHECFSEGITYKTLCSRRTPRGALGSTLWLAVVGLCPWATICVVDMAPAGGPGCLMGCCADLAGGRHSPYPGIPARQQQSLFSQISEHSSLRLVWLRLQYHQRQ